MLKLDLEKAEDLEIKLPTSAGPLKKQKSSKKVSTSASLTMLKPLNCVDHNKLWKILKAIRIPDHHIYLLSKLCACQEATELDMEQWTGSKLGKE